MAMRKSTRRELRKLRELVYHLLDGKICCFCFLPLIDTDGVQFGSGDGPPLSDKVTIHHRDGCHENNERSNRRLAHARCHKSHHARLRRRAVKAASF